MQGKSSNSGHRIAILIRTLWAGSFARIAIEEASPLENGKFVHRTVFAFTTDHERYHYEDLIESHCARVERPVFGRMLTSLSQTLFAPLTPMIRGRTSVVPGFEIVWWGVTTRVRFEYIYAEDQFAAMAGLLSNRLRGTPYFVFVAEPISHLAGIRVLKAAKGPVTTRILHKVISTLEHLVLRYATGLTFVSQNTKVRLLQVFPDLHEKRSAILYPGCHPLGSGPHLHSEAGYFLCASKWDEGRQPATALSLSAETGARIVLAGSWADNHGLTEFLRRVESSHCQGQVTVTGPLTEEAMHEVYRNAYAYIQWNPEGFGMGVVDALAAGVPVICTPAAGAAELVRHEIDGIVVPGDVPNGFSKAVSRLLSDVTLRNRLAEGAWQNGHAHTWAEHNRLLWTTLDAWTSETSPRKESRRHR